jgi:GntR family transcriptional regulator
MLASFSKRFASRVPEARSLCAWSNNGLNCAKSSQGKRSATCAGASRRASVDLSEEMRRRGLVPSARILSRQTVRAEIEVAQALRLQNEETVYSIKRLRLVNGDAVAIVDSYLPTRLFPNIDQQNLEDRSLYSIFEKVYNRRLQWAEEVIGAVSAREDEARILDAAPGSALLLIKETTFDINRIAIEYSKSLLRGDRYTASVISVRKSSLR